MRIVPLLFPTDLGHDPDRGPTGLRGAPDTLLDYLEDHGVRFARPIALEVPKASDAPARLRATLQAAQKLAEAVASTNDAGDFPLVLGGDHTALLGHALGHALRHPEGFGLAVLADAQVDLDPLDAEGAPVQTAVLGAILGRDPPGGALGAALSGVRVPSDWVTVAGVRRGSDAGVAPRAAGLDVWTLERLELDGESAYRSTLERHLARGPIALSIDARGLDSHLLEAVNDPAGDGLDWPFLKRSLEQCLRHRDRLLGLDVCELDPGQGSPQSPGLDRFAETLASFLRKLAR